MPRDNRTNEILRPAQDEYMKMSGRLIGRCVYALGAIGFCSAVEYGKWWRSATWWWCDPETDDKIHINWFDRRRQMSICFTFSATKKMSNNLWPQRADSGYSACCECSEWYKLNLKMKRKTRQKRATNQMASERRDQIRRIPKWLRPGQRGTFAYRNTCDDRKRVLAAVHVIRSHLSRSRFAVVEDSLFLARDFFSLLLLHWLDLARRGSALARHGLNSVQDLLKDRMK